jgi:hypothetical protein
VAIYRRYDFVLENVVFSTRYSRHDALLALGEQMGERNALDCTEWLPMEFFPAPFLAWCLSGPAIALSDYDAFAVATGHGEFAQTGYILRRRL